MQSTIQNTVKHPSNDTCNDRGLVDKMRAIRDEHDADTARSQSLPARLGQAICTVVPAPMALWAGMSLVDKTGPVDNIHLAGALGVTFFAATMFFKFRPDFAKAAKTLDYNGLLDDLVDFTSRRAIVATLASAAIGLGVAGISMKIQPDGLQAQKASALEQVWQKACDEQGNSGIVKVYVQGTTYTVDCNPKKNL